MSDAEVLVARSPVCTEEVCITCSDELIAVVIRSVSDDGITARGSADGVECEINVELIDGAAPGDEVLTQAGVALQRTHGDQS